MTCRRNARQNRREFLLSRAAKPVRRIIGATHMHVERLPGKPLGQDQQSVWPRPWRSSESMMCRMRRDTNQADHVYVDEPPRHKVKGAKKWKE